jgi:hypothetical protein
MDVIKQEEKKSLVTFDDKYDLRVVLNSLPDEDATEVIKLRDELADTWSKKQIFRTETEMRVSVLNDVKHPTPASKYWQAVREQSAHFDALMGLTFELRRNEVKRLKLEKQMQDAIDKNDELEMMEVQIELDENLYQRANMNQVAHDRVRELKLWSKIKDELNTGDFDTKDVNTHQSISYGLYWKNRVNALNEHSSPGDIINAIGPLQTFERLKTEDNKLLTFNEARECNKKLNENNDKTPKTWK